MVLVEWLVYGLEGVINGSKMGYFDSVLSRLFDINQISQSNKTSNETWCVCNGGFLSKCKIKVAQILKYIQLARSCSMFLSSFFFFA